MLISKKCAIYFVERKWPDMTKFLGHQWTNPNCFLRWTCKGIANPEHRTFAYRIQCVLCAPHSMLYNMCCNKAANYIYIINSNTLLYVNFILKYVSISVSSKSAEFIVVGERTECRGKNGVFEQEAKLGQSLWRGPGSERRSPVRPRLRMILLLFHLCHLINFLWQVLNKAI